ncbi:hypothetical protein ACQ29_gp303 [Escherichia phage PBECO4]|uniref:Uncharacterized protein n=1 Tax=Escherichia phage PBECO4 TaxID=1273738 RepID=L7TLI4_9CAUD|nr:hypothetical protein ACQ29_gp303 [Escherichia phage PBECO4]AGC34983.1 hypothetical protein [Escherichia phage PBECO4]
MLEFFKSDTMISITLIYLFGFFFYHALVVVLWYFKKKIVFKLYPVRNSSLILYTLVQGLFAIVGLMAHLIYCANPHLNSISQYIVFLGLFIWLGVYLIHLIIHGRDKIRGDF